MTVSLDEMTFLEPVHIGEVLTLHASVNDVGTTSMECGVRVEAENPITGRKVHAASAYLVFVAIDEDGQPAPVPPIVAETETEQRRQREAKLRRAARMEHKEAIKTDARRRREPPDAAPVCVGGWKGRLATKGNDATMTSELAGARGSLETADGAVDLHRLSWLTDQGVGDLARLPKTVLILLENLLRRAGTRDVSDDDVRALAAWPGPASDIAFMPGRVLMQDLTGVPAVVDLAAMRSAMARSGGDPAKVNPLVPADLIIDHSVQVDLFRSEGAYAANIEWEYRAQRRALRPAPLGAAGVRRPARRAAGRRDLPPGEPRAPRTGRDGSRRRRVPRHGRGDRLAHHDDQRPRRARLGRRRDRGRGGDARAADLPAAAGRRRDPDRGRAARRDDGDGPRADPHRDAARTWRGRAVRRVLRRRALVALDRRPRDAVEHVPGVRSHVLVLPDRRRDAPVPGVHGT